MHLMCENILFFFSCQELRKSTTKTQWRWWGFFVAPFHIQRSEVWKGPIMAKVRLTGINLRCNKPGSSAILAPPVALPQSSPLHCDWLDWQYKHLQALMQTTCPKITKKIASLQKCQNDNETDSLRYIKSRKIWNAHFRHVVMFPILCVCWHAGNQNKVNKVKVLRIGPH